MNIPRLAIASIKSQPLPSCLGILSMAAGMTILCAVFLFATALETGFRRNAEKIDIVSGVKGSPLQLVLSSIYHIDVPAGNITKRNMEEISKNPKIKKIIPVAMGDSYRGFRVIGTTLDYLGIYKAEISEGVMFQKSFEAVAGSLTDLKIGAEFSAQHGLSGEGGHHMDHYRITGILKPTGTVLDRLIITPIESVQEAHHHEGKEHHDEIDNEPITALLIQIRNPAAVMNLPREISQSADVTAVSPSYIMARFSRDLGVGEKSLKAIGFSFLALSILIILTMLIIRLESRKYDLAVLRVLGASPLTIMGTVMVEGLILALAGTVAGLFGGHILAYSMIQVFDGLKNILDPALFILPSSTDFVLLVCGIGCGVLGGVVPAVMALRTNVADLLSKGRI